LRAFEKIILLKCVLQTDSKELTRYGIGKPKKKLVPKKKGVPPWGNGWQRGILMPLVCAVLNSPYRAVGTSGLWSLGRPTPDGGDGNGIINKKTGILRHLI